MRPWTTGPRSRAGTKVRSATIRITDDQDDDERRRVGAQRARGRPARRACRRASRRRRARRAAGGSARRASPAPPSTLAKRDPEGAGVGAVGLEVAGVAGERRAVVVAPATCRRRASRRSPAGPRRRSRALPHLVPIASAVATSTIIGTRDRADDRELDLARLDLLAEELGRAADHQARDEDAEDDEQQHPVEARADPAPDHLAGHASRSSGRRRRAR